MTEKTTEAEFVEYKIPAKERRKIAETHVYSNLDCNKKLLSNLIIFL
jgi:hypothetical protein